MRRPVPPHRASGGGIPPVETFEALVEKTEKADDHWFWGGDFMTFDCDRYAVLRAPLMLHSPRNGLYIVARALWVSANGVDPKERLSLVNTCGRPPCVNPAHVDRAGRTSNMTLPSAVQMLDGVGVRLIRCTVRVHIVPDDVDYAICGWRIRASHKPEPGVPITCDECVATWMARGYSLQELP